jgi:hypothetical protein
VLRRAVLVIAEVGALMALVIVAGLVVIAGLIRDRDGKDQRRSVQRSEHDAA